MNLRLLNILYLLVAMVAGLWPAAVTAATPTASDILAKGVAALKAAPSVEAHFTASAQGTSASGSIIIAGNCFRLTTDEVSVWFNGRTQWAYSPSMGEVNISEPTLEELGQINPFAVVNGLQKGYKGRRLKAAGGVEKIELTPLGKAGPYTRVILSLNARSYLPTHIDLTGTDGTKVSIAISSIKKGAALPQSAFVFNPRLYPGVEIVDLR